MFLKFDDVDLFVSAFGTGPRTLAVHGGWVGSGELWHPPFQLLSRNWRTITYDHRGTGATIDRSPAITFDLLVDDLFRVLDALEVQTCVLAGEASGATVVLEAALCDPARFEGARHRRWSLSGRQGRERRSADAGLQNRFSRHDGSLYRCLSEEERMAERRWGKQIVNRSNGKAAVGLMECLQDLDLEEKLSLDRASYTSYMAAATQSSRWRKRSTCRGSSPTASWSCWKGPGMCQPFPVPWRWQEKSVPSSPEYVEKSGVAGRSGQRDGRARSVTSGGYTPISGEAVRTVMHKMDSELKLGSDMHFHGEPRIGSLS